MSIAATPVTVSFDKTQAQITVLQKWILGHEQKCCSFEDLDRIVVERILVGNSRHNREPTLRYALFIVLKSGDPILRYDYFQRPPADHIANAIRQFLSSPQIG